MKTDAKKPSGDAGRGAPRHVPRVQGSPRLPLLAIPPDVVAQLVHIGGRPRNVHRVMASQPTMLRVWVRFLYSLLQECKTPRPLRELMILRGAQLYGCDYEWIEHSAMARAAGLSDEKISSLAGWRKTSVFSRAERAAIAFMEAMVNTDVTDDIYDELARHYDAPAIVELALTAGAYCMVPRVLLALRVPLEGQEH